MGQLRSEYYYVPAGADLFRFIGLRHRDARPAGPASRTVFDRPEGPSSRLARRRGSGGGHCFLILTAEPDFVTIVQ